MQTPAIHIRHSNPADHTALLNLLQQANLPTEDLPDALTGFLVAYEGEQLAGTAGVEAFGETALLRSVAVTPDFQGRQVGRQLVEKALEEARANGVQEVYLITTTADGYFERYGFARIERTEAPEAIAGTQQFSGLCPASAVVMKKAL